MQWIKGFLLFYMIMIFATIPGNTLYQAAPIFPVQEMAEEPPVPTPDSSPTSNQPITYNPSQTNLPDVPSINPKVITLPSINAQATVVKVGMLENGQMGVPEKIETVGWYEPGPMPGSNGNTVLAGHVDGKNRPGAFFNLKKMKIGDLVHVEGMEGEQLTFKVKKIEAYHPEKAPIDDIFGYSPTKNLNLITCTGTFDHEAGGYEERLVVYTELVKRD